MTHQVSLTPRVWGELILLGAIWGASFLAIRIALDEVPVTTSVLHRTGWAALALWAVIALTRTTAPRGWRIWGAFFVMGALNNVIPFALMAWGQLYIETGLTSILNAATAIWGVLIAALFFADERLSIQRLVGVVLGFAGVATAIGLNNLTSFDPQSLAQMAVIVGTLSYACAGVWARKYMNGLSPLVASAGMLTCSTIIVAPLAIWVDGTPSFDLAPVTWGAIAYYTLFSTAGAYLLYYRVLAAAGAGNLLLVTLLVPPVAITLGAVLRSEALAPQAFVGFALLALGLLVLNGTVRLPFIRRSD